MRYLAIIVLTLLFSPHFTWGQKELILSQYLHNRYAINNAFAGSREGLSIFGSFRKQWVGIPGSPQSQIVTAHMPLKNMQMAVGLEAFNEDIAITSHSGFILSYTYRVRINRETWMGFSLSGGLSNFSARWNEASAGDLEDPVFSGNESSMGPQVGFGWSIYSRTWFAGISIPEFFYHDFSYLENTRFDLSRANYFATGGYIFDTGSPIELQPSFLLRYSPDRELPSDVSMTVIYDRMIWGGATWRTNNDLVGLVGFQVLPQLRVAYSYDYSIGDIGKFNKGSHEISIQYDFRYKTHSPSPKFF